MRFELPARIGATALLALVLGLSGAGVRAQDGFQEGLDAYLNGDYAKAFELWRPAAESGDEVAAFNVGVLYARGLGVDADPVEAVRWYRRSALAGYANAQFNLGAAYYNGTGAERNIGQAVSWWEKAAAREHPEAMYNLATLYRDGKLVEQDIERAKRLFEKGASLGDARAESALANLKDSAPKPEQQEAAPAAEQDPEQVSQTRVSGDNRPDVGWPGNENPEHWTVQIFAVAKQAAARQFVADNNLQDIVRIYRAEANGKTWFKGVSGSYADQTEASAARDRLAERLAGSSPWIRRYRDVQAEAAGGVPIASSTADPGTGAAAVGQGPTGNGETASVTTGGDVPVNAGEVGSDAAPENEQGSVSETGHDASSLTRDEEDSAEGGEMAEEPAGEPDQESDGAPPGGDRQAQLQRGQRAFNAQDYDKALDAWRPLAEQGVADAQYGIGFMYESGWGVEKNFSEAYRWYQLAAQQGHVKSQFNLGMLYRTGKGVAQNDALALYWIQTAADRGDERALNYLENTN